MTALVHRWQIVDFGVGNLRLHEAPLPQPGPGQILVRIDATSLNHRDLLLADNRYGVTPVLPFTPCSDLAGTVAAVGTGVTRWQGGERVISHFLTDWLDGAPPAVEAPLGFPGPGTLASHVVLDAQWVTAAPRTLSPVQASTLPCAGLTAWFALVENGGLQAGQSVLIHGTGGVALFGVQLARLFGARAIVVSGSAHKRRDVLALGASEVLARDSDWPAQVRALTQGRGVDHVLETVGGTNLARSLKAVAQGGRVALVGVLEGGELVGSAFEAMFGRVTIQGVCVGHRRALDALVRAVDANGLQPVIAGEYPLASAPQAFAHLARGPFGKVVVTA